MMVKYSSKHATDILPFDFGGSSSTGSCSRSTEKSDSSSFATRRLVPFPGRETSENGGARPRAARVDSESAWRMSPGASVRRPISLRAARAAAYCAPSVNSPRDGTYRTRSLSCHSLFLRERHAEPAGHRRPVAKQHERCNRHEVRHGCEHRSRNANAKYVRPQLRHIR